MITNLAATFTLTCMLLVDFCYQSASISQGRFWGKLVYNCKNIFLESKMKSHLILSQLLASGVFCALSLSPLFFRVCFTLGVRPNKYLKKSTELWTQLWKVPDNHKKRSAPDPDSKWKAFLEKAAGQVIREINILVEQMALYIVST